MKKIVISIATASILSLSFTGCANNSLSVSSITSNSQEQQEFKTGIITKTVKVLINDRKMAALTGASVGGLGGAAIRNKKGNTVEGAAVGAVIGGFIGAIVGKEVEAFKTTIDSKYTAYLQKQLPDGTKVEFVTKGTEVSNVNALDDINNDTLVDAIDKRYEKNGVWHYHLQKENITVTSSKKYYYLNDLVKVEFDRNYEIVKIKRLKAGVLDKKSKVVTKTVYRDRIVEKPVERVVYRDRIVEKPVEVVKEKVVYKDAPKKETVTTKTETKTESIW
ncbi:MAG: hypothetical protein U9N33_01240 [Campylobacterota bacterium]|nr:hypothetical protein [Campylobacterota bacterium]